MANERKKKDGKDPNKKRQRMRADVNRRHREAAPDRASRDEVDTVKYKPGSAGDRTRQGSI